MPSDKEAEPFEDECRLLAEKFGWEIEAARQHLTVQKFFDRFVQNLEQHTSKILPNLAIAKGLTEDNAQNEEKFENECKLLAEEFGWDIDAARQHLRVQRDLSKLVNFEQTMVAGLTWGPASEWSAEAMAALQALPDCSPEGNHTEPRLCKYADDMAQVLHGTTKEIPSGLTRSMEDEFRANNGGLWSDMYDYVVYEEAVERAQRLREGVELVRDKGHNGKRLENFAAMPEATQATLSLAEVAAIRIYTAPDSGEVTAWYREVNSALRSGASQQVQPWATSISLLISAIMKLSQLIAPGQTFYASCVRFPELESFTGRDPREVFLERGFLSCSSTVPYPDAYLGSKQQEGVLFCVESTWSSRPAAVAWLSQLPDQRELIFPPATALRLLEVARCGAASLVRAQPHISTMRHYTESLRFPWSSPSDPLEHREYDQILKFSQAWRDPQSPARRSPPSSKFASEGGELVTGDPRAAALGLEHFVAGDLAQARAAHPDLTAEVVKEFEAAGTEADREWLEYVLRCPSSEKLIADVGIRDQGRGSMRLEDFVELEEARRARLTREHVLALRLYTTPCFASLNAPLRNVARGDDGRVTRIAAAHPFPVTILLIADAIKKLRDASGAAERTLWRGMRNVEVPETFLQGGGVEMAPMSTSCELQTALQYSQSTSSIIFKLVTKNFMERGADVSFLSAFPKEAECLFPPLTFLSATGRTQRVGESVTVVEVTPRL